MISKIFNPVPCLNEEYLNNWRNLLLRIADNAGILYGPRETIDFPKILSEIKEYYLNVTTEEWLKILSATNTGFYREN